MWVFFHFPKENLEDKQCENRFIRLKTKKTSNKLFVVLKTLKYKWNNVAIKQFDVETSNRILYMQDIHLNKKKTKQKEFNPIYYNV